MTDSLLRRVRPRIAVAPMQRRDLQAAYAVCATNPIAYVMPAQHIETAIDSGRMRAGGLWAVHEREGRGREIVGVVWAGANMVPAIPGADEDTLADIGDALARRLGRPGALVGEADVVRALWERTRDAWGPARTIRESQHLMAIDVPPVPQPLRDELPIPLEPVREARLDDFAALLPAAVDMFKGEVGYDPLVMGRASYEDRLRWLIRSGRSFVQYGTLGGRRQVLFKAEVGVLSRGPGSRPSGVAELQGVWVHKELRRRGLGRAGLAATIGMVQERLAPTVSLYVNDFNAPAVRAYDALGFRRVGEFVTVML